MNYTSKSKQNHQLSHLFICISLPSTSSEPTDLKHQAPQRQDFVLDTPGLACEKQAELFELLRCEFNSGSEVIQCCTKSVAERKVFELCNSEVFEWTVCPKTNWKFLEWWTVTHPFFVSMTLFKDEYGLDLIIVVTGYRGDKGAGRDD